VTESDPLARRIERLEESYEFMLAYAAQGREREGGGPGPGIRETLTVVDEVLDGLAAVALERAGTDGGETGEEHRAFVEVLRDDATKARAAVRLVLAQRSISSQMVDNLNASIHVRALLTDLFLLDEAGDGTRD
jgi:hypothetical protein